MVNYKNSSMVYGQYYRVPKGYGAYLLLLIFYPVDLCVYFIYTLLIGVIQNKVQPS